ncbi:MAG: Ppx/GppA family phosphatase [Chloroflexi bacterium]|nr:Ppx/GppA family phosphatase [Chloroflexota bacterium]MBV9595766.1 Ppx/GppA family phosphatase [Chloroflexota bacterium]
MAGQTLGVIDIGSNSGRVLVAHVRGAAHLDVLGDARSPLRLVRDVARDGELSTETIDRTLRIVRGFVAVATSSGAERTMAVATAAVREATNGEQFIERTRDELGIPVDIANGDEEARLGFLGAVHGLPVEDGVVLDVGGGSIQLIHFRGRKLERSWSLPLGALRLSDRFLKSDPPSRGEMRALREHIQTTLERAGIRPLGADERLVGTGGTVRNLAKVDRRMRSTYPISRLHAYVLDRRRVDGVASLLSGMPANNRAMTPGLNADRADSIVGGGLVVQAVMDRLLATELTVAGYGLREGVALNCVTDEAASIEQVQNVAVSALGGHFTAYDSARAERRVALVNRLLARLLPGAAVEVMLAAAAAARLLDIGASIDYYRRHEHSARIVCDANLDGYTHRTLALTAAGLCAVGERVATVKGYAPLLVAADQRAVEQIAAGVALADALVRYGSGDPETITLERTNGHVVLAAPVVDDWPLETPTRRAERAFGASISRNGAA